MDAHKYVLIEFDGKAMHVPFQDNYTLFITELAKTFNLPCTTFQNIKSTKKLFEVIKQNIKENKIRKFIIVKPDESSIEDETIIHNELQKIQSDLKQMISNKLEKIGENIFNELYPQIEKEFKQKYSLTKPKLQSENENNTNIQCRGCNLTCFNGIRFKCAICEDFNYCQQCKNKYGATHGHKFIQLNTLEASKILEDIYLVQKPKESSIFSFHDDSIINIDINESIKELPSSQLTVHNLKAINHQEKRSFEILNEKLSFTIHNNNTSFTSVLTLKNNGNEIWPYPLYLNCQPDSTIKGNKIKIPKELKPGDSISLKVQFDLSKLNKQNGKYCSIWRIENEKKQCFIDKPIEFELHCVYKSKLEVKTQYAEIYKKHEIIDAPLNEEKINDDHQKQKLKGALPSKKPLLGVKGNKINYMNLLKEFKKEINIEICPDDNTLLNALIMAGGSKEGAKKNLLNKRDNVTQYHK